MSRSLVGCRSTTTRGRERKRKRKRKTGIWQSSQQLIIGSYYWGTVSARREVGFHSLLKTLMVQNRPHYRDIISIHTLTELLGCLLGKIRFLHLRTSSLSAWLTEPCSQFVAHPRCTDGLEAHIQCNPSAADVQRERRCGERHETRFNGPAAVLCWFSLQKATFGKWGEKKISKVKLGLTADAPPKYLPVINKCFQSVWWNKSSGQRWLQDPLYKYT